MKHQGFSTLKSVFGSRPIAPVLFETLEGRQLLSACAGGGGRGQVSTIEFDQAPAAVQAGLNALATTDSLSAPSSTQLVYLGNSNGVETYTVDITGTGTDTRLTVDVNGSPVTAPTKSATTFGAISDTDVTDEFNTIAAALGLTAPALTDAVSVSTPAGGQATYTMRLVNSSSTRARGVSISVDADGNPVGNASIPFSAMPTAIQSGLNANAPSGATQLDATSTQKVRILTANGITFYSTTFTSSGTSTKVTVDSTGALKSLPSSSTTTFSSIPTPAQTELQTLATADGFSGTIDSTRSVRAYDESNGTTIYSVTVAVANGSGTGMHNITISVDQAGNPTVAPGKSVVGAPIYGGTSFQSFRFGRRGHFGF